MPFNGSGVFTRAQNWVADATAGIKIRADRHDIEDDGFAAGLSQCITRDGQSTITANIAFNGKRITGLADPAADQDAVTRKYYQGNSTFTGAVTVSGASPLGRIAFTEADMSWVGKAAAAVGTGPRQRIAAMNTAAGTSTELVQLDDIGVVNLASNGLHFNNYIDANNTDFKRNRTGAVAARLVPGTSSFFIQVAPAGAVNSVIDLAGAGAEIAYIDINPVGAFGFRPPDGANPAQLNLYGPATGAGANISSGQLNFYSANNLRRAYIWYDQGQNRTELLGETGNMALGPIAAGTILNFYSGHATQARWSFTVDSDIVQAPTRVTDNLYGSSIIWHTFGGAQVVDHSGPGSTHGIIFSNRLLSPNSASHCLFLWSSAAAGTIVSSSALTTSYGTTSDIRLKKGVKEVIDARALVDALQVVEYTPAGTLPEVRSVEGTDAGPATYMGIPAQQAYTVFPTAVIPPDTDTPTYREGLGPGDEGFMPWMIDYSKFVPMILANTQENNARLDAIEARLNALEAA